MSRQARYKPVYFMHQEGVSPRHVTAVLEAIRELLRLAGKTAEITVTNWGVWKHKAFLNEDGSYARYHSVDWYIEFGRSHSQYAAQLNGDAILHGCMCEPWQTAPTNHYDVVLVREDLRSNEDDNKFVIGLAIPQFATVMSTFRFLGLDEDEQAQCIKTEALHEVGHVFGLPAGGRGTSLSESLGRHCTNECVMRQGLSLPDDWQRMTRDRLKSEQPFCQECLRDLDQYFDV